jgi:hypothetical protein
MLNLFARVQLASKDITRLKQIIDEMPKNVSMVGFSEHMCSTCPFMCDDCDFCFMIFKYNKGKECFKKIIKKLVFSFYYGIDISTLTFLSYYICPICLVGCKDIYNGNDCPYDYIKQFNNYTNMFTKPSLSDVTSKKRSQKKATIKFDHKKGVLVIKKPGSCEYEPVPAEKTSPKPHILIEGQTMIKVINNLWGVNENTSQTRDNST